VKVVKAKIEEVTLPVEKVDIIISEWMVSLKCNGFAKLMLKRRLDRKNRGTKYSFVVEFYVHTAVC